MRRFYLILLVLLLVESPCRADGLLINSFKYAATSSPTYVLSTNWEETGQPSGWTPYTDGGSGSVNYDYTTSPAPLVGSQSLYLYQTGGRRYEYIVFGATSPCYVYLVAAIKTASSTHTPIFHIDDASINGLFIVRREGTNGYARVTDLVSETDHDSTFVLTVGNVYQYWFERSSGGTVSLYIAAAGSSKPGTPAVSFTAGSSDQWGMIALTAEYGGENIFDKLRVDDVTIGSSPE